MDGGFSLVWHPGVVNSQFQARHYETEAAARTAADKIIAEQPGVHFVMVVPCVYFERGMESKARQERKAATKKKIIAAKETWSVAPPDGAMAGPTEFIYEGEDLPPGQPTGTIKTADGDVPLYPR